MAAVAGRRPARWTGAGTGGSYVQTVPARGDLRRLVREGGRCLTPSLGAGLPSLHPVPFLSSPLPSGRPPAPPHSHPALPVRRDGAPRGRPGEPPPRPRCSLRCRVRRRSPGSVMCSRWEACFGRRRATSRQFLPSFSPLSLSFIHLFIFSRPDFVSRHSGYGTGLWGREDKILERKRQFLLRQCVLAPDTGDALSFLCVISLTPTTPSVRHLELCR